MFVGEILSTATLAIGEIGALLVRGIFALIVGICDVTAASMCCCRVPFSDRPDRDGYTYSTVRTPVVMSDSGNANAAALAATPTGESKPKRFVTRPDMRKFEKGAYKTPMQLFAAPKISYTPKYVQSSEAKDIEGSESEHLESPPQKQKQRAGFFSHLTRSSKCKAADDPAVVAGEKSPAAAKA